MIIKSERLLKGSAFILTAVLLFNVCGCAKKDIVDRESLQAIVSDFLKALADEDNAKMKECTRGFDYEQESSGIQRSMGELYSVVSRSFDRAQITYYDDPEINSETMSASMDVTISYVDFEKYSDSQPSEYMKLEDMISAVDSCNGRKESIITIRFVYDSNNRTYKMTSASARKIYSLLTSKAGLLHTPVSITPDEAKELFENYLKALASGDFSSLGTDFTNDNKFRVYDDIVSRGSGSRTDRSVKSFVKAYMSYIMEHDYEIVSDEPYHFELKGSAPSSEALSSVLTEDEFLTEYYMNIIRYTKLGKDIDTLLEDQSVLLYETLAKAIPGCKSEAYTVTGNVSYRDGQTDKSTSPLTITSDLINHPVKTVYNAEHGATLDQVLRCNGEAINRLYRNGEMSEDLYNSMIEELTPENYGFTTDNKVSPSGYPNQANGVYEQVPEWCEDGSMVYGYSSPDANGFWMHYSKSPKVFDTAGYYIDNNGVRITCYFINSFPAGKALIADWWADGEKVIDSYNITVGAAGSNAVEVYLPTNGMPTSGKIEMRLWEDDHSHVLSYVTIYH